MTKTDSQDAKQMENRLAKWACILGIIGIVLTFFIAPLYNPLCFISYALAVIARIQIKRNPELFTGMHKANTGMILSISSILITVLMRNFVIL